MVRFLGYISSDNHLLNYTFFSNMWSWRLSGCRQYHGSLYKWPFFSCIATVYHGSRGCAELLSLKLCRPWAVVDFGDSFGSHEDSSWHGFFFSCGGGRHNLLRTCRTFAAIIRPRFGKLLFLFPSSFLPCVLTNTYFFVVTQLGENA